MDFILSIVLSIFIIVPAVIGLIRFRKISEAYYPFIYCIWAGFLNEMTGIISIKLIRTNVVNLNIYILVEFLLITWQFKKWNLFGRKLYWPGALSGGMIIFWCIESFFISKMKGFNSYFIIVYSASITFMSISMINRLIVTERRSLLKNPIFIICIAFVLYYTLNVLSESFWVYGINANNGLSASVGKISLITNFIAIILYSISILWMPTKQRFTLPSS
jgi:hypothetical protein